MNGLMCMNTLVLYVIILLLISINIHLIICYCNSHYALYDIFILDYIILIQPNKKSTCNNWVQNGGFSIWGRCFYKGGRC